MKVPDNVRTFPLVIGLVLFAVGMISMVFSLQTSSSYNPADGFHSAWMISTLSCLAVGLSGVLIGFAFGGTRLFILPLCTVALGVAGFFVIQDKVATSYASWASERYGVSVSSEDWLKASPGDTIHLLDGRNAKVMERDGKVFLGLESDPGVEMSRHSKYAN